MKIAKSLVLLLLSLIFFFAVFSYAFDNSDIFWYLYPFIILIGIAISILSSNQKDEVSLWKCLLFGIGYGVILYGLIRLSYLIFNLTILNFSKSITKFISNFGPNNIWHYLLLVFIIVVGEELFWRGFVQQTIRNWISSVYSIIITSILYAGPFIINGHYTYGLLTLIVGIFLGILYDWKKSMPLNIVVHEVYILLLFLLIPFI
ncbi:MAG TPA: CPBP family intramembrane glutamic endopeptidase [Ureibacillus sp.]|nr:CPBP family intramembrane glutamic endopeptidase [Ureibacillus sp.]